MNSYSRAGAKNSEPKTNSQESHSPKTLPPWEPPRGQKERSSNRGLNCARKIARLQPRTEAGRTKQKVERERMVGRGKKHPPAIKRMAGVTNSKRKKLKEEVRRKRKKAPQSQAR